MIEQHFHKHITDFSFTYDILLQINVFQKFWTTDTGECEIHLA